MTARLLFETSKNKTPWEDKMYIPIHQKTDDVWYGINRLTEAVIQYPKDHFDPPKVLKLDDINGVDFELFLA